ncbi:hypothetical protein BN946_scf185007.g29 [Trametes cinnabarina]|uniref:Homeobox domain-containing protein n=1 Tax=Pycnoporus cinnabarinus TaxID=5643 RepID=A0A060SF18_PYCCI|nr:hypothetical protein BN946_scf185007.g29 [Trametes cinnabarina]
MALDRSCNTTPPHSPTISACSSTDSIQTAPARYPTGPIATRKRLAPAQTSALVSVFEVKTHPSREERALLAAELGMELKAVNAWFQNKRRTLKKNCAGCGWSKGSLPENKHVRPANGLKALPRSESRISLERVASSHELPYKPKPIFATRALPRVPHTPRRRAAAAETSREIWEYLPSSPPTRPSSPGHAEALLSMACTKRARSLEWACAKARAGRKALKKSSRRSPVKSAVAEDHEDEDEDVPMLVLDEPPADSPSFGGSESDSTEEDEEAITPNVSTEMLPPLVASPDGDSKTLGEDVDMEAAIALLHFTAPKA